MDLFWWRGKKLRTIWRVEKGDQESFLVGTAHFSPFSFRKPLTQIIKKVNTILFEGPLDQESMEKVVEYGRRGGNMPSLYEALEPTAMKEINRELSHRLKAQTLSTDPYFDLLYSPTLNPLEAYTRGVRPWLAFFTIWSTLLDWKYSMDVEAFNIAQKLGKKINYLESLEDQLRALDGIPFERFVNFLNHIEKWKGYRKMFLQTFLSGDLEKFASMTGEFPTRCDSIVEKRDPVFFKRIKASSEKESVVAFVGVIHIPGIRKRFLEEGYQITQEEL